MADTTPTREPQQLVAGDTWRWRRNDLTGQYPAGEGWVLTYTLINALAKITVTASADGDAFLVNVPAATTAAHAAGVFGWEAAVANGTDRFRVGQGTVEVLASFAAAATLDTTTHARRTLAAIEAVIERRASKDQNGYTIDGRRLDRTPIPDLLLLRDRYKREVAREVEAERVAQGRGTGRMVLTRFGRRV